MHNKAIKNRAFHALDSQQVARLLWRRYAHMATSPPVEINNSKLVTDWFGYWPSFHDSEVISVTLHRSQGRYGKGPTLRSEIYAFKMTSEVTESGFYKLTHQCVVELEFHSIESLNLDGFNHQNALDDIEISEVLSDSGEKRLSVLFNSAWGVGFDLVCSGISVISLVPGTPADHLHA